MICLKAAMIPLYRFYHLTRVTISDTVRTMKTLLRSLAAFSTLAVAVNLFSSAALAAASPWAETDNSALRIISQTDAVGDGDTVMLGLQFKLKEHWKIYWRAPGDAGYPPEVEWEGSTNVQDATISWPLPERFSILGFETLGYTGDVVLPLTVKLNQAGQAMALKTQISYLACAEICVPYDTTLDISLPAGAATPSAESYLISKFSTLVPRTGPDSGKATGLEIKAAQYQIDPAGDGDRGILYLNATSLTPVISPDAYFEGPEALDFDKPTVSISRDNKTALFKVGFEGLKKLKTPFDQSQLTITLADAPRGAEFKITPTPVTPETLALADDLAVPDFTGPSLWVMLGLGLLGGLILNLMPCVLPVLSIKLLGVVSHGGSSTKTVRLSFLATSAGIVSSFLVLAGILIGLKTAGLSIGWGIQFQQPWFLIAMALVITLFACNLWGFFEVGLPRSISTIGEGSTHVRGFGGHFMTGALATLLATPCSAPFLGTAVGFALARGPFEIMSIFAMLGIGLAGPYLLVATFPKFATKMPKPGRWMVILRRVLGFFLAATSVWLVSIISYQINTRAALIVGGLLVLITVVLLVHKRLHHKYGRLDWALVAVLAVITFGVPQTISASADEEDNYDKSKLDALWTPFEARAIGQYIADGKVVFVDVTAEWCITCQVNKAAVISKGEVYKRLNGTDTIAMQADWTRPSEAITDYLASFGRYGIPFNAVYGPGAPKGIILPELLSQSSVLKALDQAGSGAMAVAN